MFTSTNDLYSLSQGRKGQGGVIPFLKLHPYYLSEIVDLSTPKLRTVTVGARVFSEVESLGVNGVNSFRLLTRIVTTVFRNSSNSLLLTSLVTSSCGLRLVRLRCTKNTPFDDVSSETSGFFTVPFSVLVRPFREFSTLNRVDRTKIQICPSLEWFGVSTVPSVWRIRTVLCLNERFPLNYLDPYTLRRCSQFTVWIWRLVSTRFKTRIGTTIDQETGTCPVPVERRRTRRRYFPCVFCDNRYSYLYTFTKLM